MNAVTDSDESLTTPTGLGPGVGSSKAVAQRDAMQRTFTDNIRAEQEDLKEAAEHSLTVIVDVGLDGRVRWVSPTWQDVIGTASGSVPGSFISDISVDDPAVFETAAQSLQTDDSRSKFVRFRSRIGPLSVLKPPGSTEPAETTEATETLDDNNNNNNNNMTTEALVVDLEGQGIMAYDHAAGGTAHIMWMIRPSTLREVTIDLPQILVESLGVGAEVLAQYLTGLAKIGLDDPGSHPPPLPILCRICERQITPWWFEKHSDLCMQEHRAELEIQLTQENLSEHRITIVQILDSLETLSLTRAVTSVDIAPPKLAPPKLSTPEYKGFTIGLQSGPPSTLPSGRSSPVGQPARPGEISATQPGHERSRSFAIRRPLSRIVELVLDLCDTALEINAPSVQAAKSAVDTPIRTQSPHSESLVSQVIQWQSPGSSTLELEQGLALLCADTSNMAKAKVEAVLRHKRILEYSERLRVEFEILVQECINAAIEKASQIAAGEMSDSSDDAACDASSASHEYERSRAAYDAVPVPPIAPSAISLALQHSNDLSLPMHFDGRRSSAATSARSSSPRGAQTPKSTFGPNSGFPPSKRASIHFESDAGAESDSSALSSAFSGYRRADSPSDMGLTRVGSARERKRRSLILPSMSNRQPSPSRGQPASPLKLSRARLPSGTEGVHSPVTSPLLSSTDFPSPVLTQQHFQQHQHHHHHRRQSSNASDLLRGPTSPRLIPMSNPQPRAVPPSIKDFEIVKPISKGAFGSVYLSKKKSTGDYFAIKVLKKADMVAKNQVTNVKAERAIMMWQGESDFVAKLYWTFSSKDYLYLVMEYLNGGDCGALIKTLGGLSVEWSKRYLAEVILGVEHLHKRGIVHRDLKPDNLLIDQRGHLKLTDFGLSRMGLIGRQKRALNNKNEDSVPDLLKQGPFHRALSVTSSRSTSFDLQRSVSSPIQTPSLTPSFPSDFSQPSYFSLNRESSSDLDFSRRASLPRSDSGEADSLPGMLRRFSIMDEHVSQSRFPVDDDHFARDQDHQESQGLHPTTSSTSSGHNGTPPQTSGMLPPRMALFDPQDTDRRFVGTPDYLAPETINGSGQDEISDWWSIGCILFEFLYGYPPFHADTPDAVFENILARKIQWPDLSDDEVPLEAKDLTNKLLCSDPGMRLGANASSRFASGGQEVKSHVWFADVNWNTMRDDDALFVPTISNPEDTEYFDARGATLQSFDNEFEDQSSSPVTTPAAEYAHRPHDALSKVRNQLGSSKRGLMPLHIPPHVRDGRSRRLSEPVAADDFGNFSFKNLPVLDKANKDVIQKLRAEALQSQNKPNAVAPPSSISSPTPSLESSPMLPMHLPLKRTISANKSRHRQSSPSLSLHSSASPGRISQPSSPLLVQFSTGLYHERRKTSNASSASGGLFPQAPPSSQGNNPLDSHRLSASFVSPSATSSPVKTPKSFGYTEGGAAERGLQPQLPVGGGGSALSSPRGRSHTVGSQESDSVRDLVANRYKRRSAVYEASPSSSDNEDPRQRALLRVQRRRHSSQRLSLVSLDHGPIFRSLDVLVCEDHPVSRMVMERLLEKLKCRTIVAQNGSEAMRYALGAVKFDIIMTEYKLPQVSGADVARMLRDTRNSNHQTPIVAVTGYLKGLQTPHHFDYLIEKPPTIAKLTDALTKLCHWRTYSQTQMQSPVLHLPAVGQRHGSQRLEDSPSSNSSGYAHLMSSSYRVSSQDDSISSSFFTDTDSQRDDGSQVSNRRDRWGEPELTQALGGLGISRESPESHDYLTLRLPQLQHQCSAPAALEQRLSLPELASEMNSGRQRSKLIPVQDDAESGDDEDEELGNTQGREKSPKGRNRQSKLGIEMLRTNSQGSVISVEGVAGVAGVAGSATGAEWPSPPPPPPVAEDGSSEASSTSIGKAAMQMPSSAMTTPPKSTAQMQRPEAQIADSDITPKPLHVLNKDPDPTPRASSRPASRAT